MLKQHTEPCTHVPFSELVDLLTRIFEKHGVSPGTAAVLATNCASAQRDGSDSHGIFRIPGYLSTLASGWVDGAAEPQVEDVAGGFLAVDAKNGFAQAALEAVRSTLNHKARQNGVALAAIRNSHHFGALWPDIEPFATDGLIALTVVNSMTSVVPHGGKRALFGTNPIGFAAPRIDGQPLVFDMATSAIAHGDVQIAAREGRQLPENYGVDSRGEPTTDPNAVLNGGALLPFGGHKGSALSMMVELLAAGLTGGNYSFGFDWSDHPGAEIPKTGQLVIVIDPAKVSVNDFATRVEELITALRGVGQSRMPGERRYRQRAESTEKGVSITNTQLDQLKSLAGEA